MDIQSANVSGKELQTEILFLKNNNVSNWEKAAAMRQWKPSFGNLSLPLWTRFFVTTASPWFTAGVSFICLANKTTESVAMGTLDWPSNFCPEGEQSSVLTTEELQSVKYISRKTSIMNQTSEVAITTLQIWKLRRLMVPVGGERYILRKETKRRKITTYRSMTFWRDDDYDLIQNRKKNNMSTFLIIYSKDSRNNRKFYYFNAQFIIMFIYTLFYSSTSIRFLSIVPREQIIPKATMLLKMSKQDLGTNMILLLFCSYMKVCTLPQ